MFRRNLIPVWIGIILLSGTFLMGQGAECPWGMSVDFPDPNLEDYIRHEIGKLEGEICVIDLLSVYIIYYIPGWPNDISDLTGLEFCVNLVQVWLADGQITDLSPLARLPKLELLVLSNNQISDLSPLENSSLEDSLYGLALEGNQISDIGPLAGMGKLEGLALDDNQISDISPLSGLTGLTELYLSGNQIGDLSPLAGLSDMRWLYLDGNQISDIYPLVQNSGIGDGDEVYLTNNPLDETCCTVYIPELQSRGVTVYYDPADCPYP